MKKILIITLFICSCRSTKLDKTETDSTKKNETTKSDSGTVNISKSEYTKYLSYLKEQNKVREKVPVVLNVNGRDTLVYRYKDSTAIKINKKDSTSYSIYDLWQHWNIYEHYKIYEHIKVSEKKKETKSTGGFALGLWLSIIFFLCGYGLSWIFPVGKIITFIKNLFK